MRGQPRRRGQASHAGHQGHAAAGQGRRGRPGRRGVPRPGRHRRPAGPAWPSSRSSTDEIDALYADGEIDLRGRARPAVPHRDSCCSRRRLARLGRVNPDKQVQLVRGDREAFGLHGRSAEQRIALDLLLDPSVGIVSLGGRAGTGKSALALCAGPGGGAGAPQHNEGRGLPAAVRGRRPGARLPARQREREDGALGAGGLRHPRRAGQPRRWSRRCSTAACSRCCR